MKTTLQFFAAVLAGLIGVSLLMMALPADAQRPALPTRGPAQPTRTAFVLPTRSEDSTPVSIETRPSTREPFQFTLTPPATGDYRATVEAFSTTVQLDSTAVRATLSAVQTQLYALTTAMPMTTEELLELIEVFVESGSVAYDPETGVVTITTSYSEAAIEQIVIIVLQSAGYDTTGLSVDLVPGAILITQSDVQLTEQYSGDLVITITLTVVDGAISADVTNVAINGTSVPEALVEDQSSVILETFSSLDESTLEAAAGGEFDLNYTVDDLIITDTDLILTISISVAE